MRRNVQDFMLLEVAPPADRKVESRLWQEPAELVNITGNAAQVGGPNIEYSRVARLYAERFVIDDQRGIVRSRRRSSDAERVVLHKHRYLHWSGAIVLRHWYSKIDVTSIDRKCVNRNGADRGQNRENAAELHVGVHYHGQVVDPEGEVIQVDSSEIGRVSKVVERYRSDVGVRYRLICGSSEINRCPIARSVATGRPVGLNQR